MEHEDLFILVGMLEVGAAEAATAFCENLSESFSSASMATNRCRCKAFKFKFGHIVTQRHECALVPECIPTHPRRHDYKRH